MELPSKAVYWKIGEIANWLQLETHILRSWELEFADALNPLERSKSNHRIYSRRHAVVFGTIKELLYTELYTIAGARRQLRLQTKRTVAA